MCSPVSPDARRLITAITAATIPGPSGMINQTDILCSFLEFEHLVTAYTPADAVREAVQVRLRILMSRDGQGMGPVTEAGQKAYFPVFAGITRVSVPRAIARHNALQPKDLP